MTRRDPRPLVGDVLKYARLAMDFVSGRVRADIDSDIQLQRAVSRAVEIVGEAANQLSPLIADHYPGVEWSEVTGMRHHLVHGYSKINLDRLWETVQDDLPPLVEQFEAIAADLEGESPDR